MEKTVKGIVKQIKEDRILVKILNREIEEVYIDRDEFPVNVKKGDYIEIIDRKVYLKEGGRY
ncbi:MAG: hypothetical protein PWQ96_541 [Clostridia bacterium]|jgi:hypothetical protein|nr:hypothetical protein [Clostridiales bacterium]MDK2984899.1 hypothetical protein [Clostridia bacterium]